MKSEEMGKPDLLKIAKERFVAELDHWCDQRGFPRNELDDLVVATRPLSAFDAIGSPEMDDFPLLRGKEVLMHAALSGVPRPGLHIRCRRLQRNYGDGGSLRLQGRLLRHHHRRGSASSGT
jgi:hypothetical protein